jgi:hypothetical protein
MLKTEFEFTLPKGYIDAVGVLQREGVMRLATALDEIAPMSDPRVKANEGYLTVLLLARVVTRLGSLPQVTPQIIEDLFAADLIYLQDLYRQINEDGAEDVQVECPECHHRFQREAARLEG